VAAVAAVVSEMTEVATTKFAHWWMSTNAHMNSYWTQCFHHPTSS